MTQSKLFKSTNGGCCICRLKSSSSRFTSSKRYEDSFAGCFLLVTEQRSGDICNACVLLVKRWRTNHKGKDDRNWAHVVDSKARYGKKSAVRTKKPKTFSDCRPIQREKRQRRKLLLGEESDEKMLPTLPGVPSSPTASDCSESQLATSGEYSRLSNGVRKYKRKRKKRKKRERYFDFPPSVPPSVRSYVDLDFWQMRETCCGPYFKGKGGKILISPELIKPCPIPCSSFWKKLNLDSPAAVAEEETSSATLSSSQEEICSQSVDGDLVVPAAQEEEAEAPAGLPPSAANDQATRQVVSNGFDPGRSPTEAKEVHQPGGSESDCLNGHHRVSDRPEGEGGCPKGQQHQGGGGDGGCFQGRLGLAGVAEGGYSKGLRLEVSCSSQTHSFLGHPNALPSVGCVPQKAVQ